MILSLYVPSDSIVHRLPAGTKLLILFTRSVALFVVSGIPVHAGELVVVASLYRIARLPWRAVRPLRHTGVNPSKVGMMQLIDNRPTPEHFIPLSDHSTPRETP